MAGRWRRGYHRAVSRRGRSKAQTIEIAGISVSVTRKRVKNLNLRVRPPDGEVLLSVPYGTSDGAIQAMVQQRLGWIDRHRTLMRERPRPAYREYLTGESLDVLGQARRLRFVAAGSDPAGTGGGPEDVVLRVPLGATREVRARAVDHWLGGEAKREFAAELARWEPRLGVKVEQLGVKRMKTRWGTCNPSARRVWLNLALVERPRSCLEYVVVHELAHLLVADHSPAFWAVVERHLPTWRSAKAELACSPLWLDEER